MARRSFVRLLPDGRSACFDRHVTGPTLSRRHLIALGAAAAAMPRSARAAPPAHPAPGTRIELAIAFTRNGRRRGEERATYTFNRDGTLTMTARSESFDPAVVRDVTYWLAPDGRPREAYVRIANAGVPEGAALYRFTDTHAEVDVDNVKAGRSTRRVPLDTPVAALVAHPVTTDVMVGMAADRSRPGAVLPAKGVWLGSADPYGRTGPELVPADVAIAWLGTKPQPTPAGDRPADHYLLHLRGADGRFAPFQDLWCLAGTPVFLGGHARPPVDTRYTLDRFEIIPPS